MSENLQTIILNIKKNLPQGWDYEITDNNLKFFTAYDIYLLNENKINAPMETFQESEKNAERIKKYGKKTIGLINFEILKYKNTDELLKHKTKTVFYNDNTILLLTEEIGLTDDFNSVYPFKTSEEIYKIKNILKEYLFTVLFDSAISFSEYVDKKVLIIGEISKIPWQHLMAGDAVYKYSEYFDIDKSQIVAYFKIIPKNVKKKISLIGRIIEVKGFTKKPGYDDEYHEYAINVDEIK